MKAPRGAPVTGLSRGGAARAAAGRRCGSDQLQVQPPARAGGSGTRADGARSRDRTGDQTRAYPVTKRKHIDSILETIVGFSLTPEGTTQYPGSHAERIASAGNGDDILHQMCFSGPECTLQINKPFMIGRATRLDKPRITNN